MLIRRIAGSSSFILRYGLKAYINQRKLIASARRAKGAYHEFVPIGFRGPIKLRNGSLDDYTFREVCVNGEYNVKLPFLPKNIIDCGGNIGLSSVYFALKYPDAKIVTIEPVISNFDVLRDNIKHYPNIHGINKGIWAKTAKLKISKINGHFAAREVNDNEKADVDAVCISEVMKEYGMEMVDLLKVDIEGVEDALFELNRGSGEQAHRNEWLTRTKAIVIELHPEFRPGCVEAFEKLMTDYSFKRVQTKGDSTIVCTNFYINTEMVR